MACWRSYACSDSCFFNTSLSNARESLKSSNLKSSNLVLKAWSSLVSVFYLLMLRVAGKPSNLSSTINSVTQMHKGSLLTGLRWTKIWNHTRDRSVTDEPVSLRSVWPRAGWGTLSARLLSDLHWLLLSIYRLFGGQTGERHKITLKTLLFMFYFTETNNAQKLD